MSNFTTNQARVERYRELRAAGRGLVSKMYAATRAPQYDIVKVAKKLTIPVHDRTLLLNGESDTNALADFYLHEMRFGGRRVVDVMAESDCELSPDEHALLAAHRAARCSLFEIVNVDPGPCQILLRDLLEPNNAEIALTDISLSNCGASGPGDLLFMRIVRCDGVNMSAGHFCGFRAQHRDFLLRAYEERIWSVEAKERDQRTFIFFYQRNRELGLEQAYENVACSQGVSS